MWSRIRADTAVFSHTSAWLLILEPCRAMRESLKVPSSEVCYQEAVKGELCRLQDPEGKPPGVMGWWPLRSDTFVENHDTGSTQV